MTTPSRRELTLVGILNLALLVAAVFTFWSGLRMWWLRSHGMLEQAHWLKENVHLVFGLIFIGLGAVHLVVNRWECRRIRRGPLTFQTFFMPPYVLCFLFMAVTALLIWPIGVHGLGAMHKIVGCVFLGLVAVHACVHARDLCLNPLGRR